ncbi:mechanosensitive ion channel domain-containing protein [Hydrogenivirga sp. 128-5-R1-1]|uniref:mechanosensitive ion channel family protein n=1 Tax=Hydrogenivirga sp. 128-5-R1-1 TaxID=392423 RepID=UPI0018DC4385|nr:mechanosensitive ion channel domain-containing protein [Hydrogenivirga sp. 128-5-R1-1]
MPKLLVGLLAFLLSLFLASFVRSKVMSLRVKLGEDRVNVLNLLANFSYMSILVLGVLTSLGVVGVDVTALITGLGLTGFALGFAMKDIISNLLAGVLIILYSPFRVGDRIRVGSYEGEVLEINLRYTVLEGDGERVLVPNSTMFTNIIPVKEG